jgi:hypothetical protein
MSSSRIKQHQLFPSKELQEALADVSAISEVTSSDVIIVPLATPDDDDKMAASSSYSSSLLSFMAASDDHVHAYDPNSSSKNLSKNEQAITTTTTVQVGKKERIDNDHPRPESLPEEEDSLVHVANEMHSDGNDLPQTSSQQKQEANNNGCHPEEEECEFQIGDHVYQWCSLAFVPAVYQHHGIVMDVFYDHHQQQWMLRIADFSNWKEDDDDDHMEKTEHENEPEGSVGPEYQNLTKDNQDGIDTNNHPPPSCKKSFLRSNCSSCIRTYVSTTAVGTKDRWHKVQYQAGWWKRHVHRSGTCTAARCDAPGIVRARVQFLVEHPEVLPRYNVFSDNCECVAVWCKTGTWATLQASSWLYVTAAGQAKSAVTVAGAVSAMQVSVPAAGAWGWLGYTQTVPLVSTQPLLLPAIAVYGVVTVGAPAFVLARAKHHWQEITISLNTAFWEHAVANPTTFADCITEWSSKYEPDITTAIELTKLDDEHDVDGCGEDGKEKEDVEENDAVAQIATTEQSEFTVDNIHAGSDNDLERAGNNSNVTMNETLQLEKDTIVAAADLVVEQSAGQESRERGKRDAHKYHFLSFGK